MNSFDLPCLEEKVEKVENGATVSKTLPTMGNKMDLIG